MMNGPYVPIENLAKHFSVSISTIRGWVRNGHIPKDTYVKIGNTYRFCVEDVSDALTTKERDTNVPVTSVVSSIGIGSLGVVDRTIIDDDL
jgi:excisionase family DNA binding protein